MSQSLILLIIFAAWMLICGRFRERQLRIRHLQWCLDLMEPEEEERALLQKQKDEELAQIRRLWETNDSSADRAGLEEEIAQVEARYQNESRGMARVRKEIEEELEFLKKNRF